MKSITCDQLPIVSVLTISEFKLECIKYGINSKTEVSETPVKAITSGLLPIVRALAISEIRIAYIKFGMTSKTKVSEICVR